MISLPTYATSGGSAAARTVSTPSASVPPGDERQTSPSVRPDCETLPRRRSRRPTEGGPWDGKG